MSGLLLALYFLLTAYFDRLSLQSKIKKEKNARNSMKVILICCHGNQNLDNNCIFVINCTDCQIGSLMIYIFYLPVEI